MEVVEASRPSDKVKLYIAALKGDYGKAKEVKDDINRRITEQGETTLHIAILARQKQFIKMLVKKLKADEQDLEARNNADNDVLYYAAASGDVDIAKILMEDNSFNVVKADNPLNVVKALDLAATLNHVGMVEYLNSQIRDRNYFLMSEDQQALLTTFIRIGLYDIASEMLRCNPELAKKALNVLASTPSVFAETKQDGAFNRLIHSCFHTNPKYTKIANRGNLNQSQVVSLVEQCYNAMNYNTIEEVSELLFKAAEAGNVEFLKQLIHFNPDLIWVEGRKGSIFHVAVEYRHENIFNLLFELGAIKDLIATRITEDGKNTILHLAAKLAPAQKLKAAYGPALQMYQELLWFKEVEKIVPTVYKELENGDHDGKEVENDDHDGKEVENGNHKGKEVENGNHKGHMPRALFEETHKNLREAGEKWMKDTAESSMLVATLIATVMFTAALSVPGGFDNSNGRPLLRKDTFFTVFSISDAVGLLFSSASILMFLSFHTSRFGEYDFLKSVPRFMIGNAFLCISITAMMVSFSAIIVLYYHHQGVAFITFVTVAFVPILCFSQNYRLFCDYIFHHCIGPSFSFQASKTSVSLV